MLMILIKGLLVAYSIFYPQFIRSGFWSRILDRVMDLVQSNILTGVTAKPVKVVTSFMSQWHFDDSRTARLAQW